MKLYPLFACLAQRHVVVVGGGVVAARKVDALLAAGARVTVVAAGLSPALRRLAGAGALAHRGEAFRDSHLDDAWLVVAATADRGVNRAVAAAAAARRLFANVVDDAELSSFHVPAVVDRTPVTVAISSGGQAPMFARLLRERLEAVLDPSLGALAALAGRLRPRLRRLASGHRRRFHEWLYTGPVARLLRQGHGGEAHALALRVLRGDAPAATGSVVLVGAGPGDPGLLTLRGLRALNEADVILHDRLGAEVLALARRDAERIEVGKRVGGGTGQQAIHALMLQHARAGRRVVRLKGGDPFVFGRGGEELEFLRAHGVAYEVVPGITAATACAAGAGVPLTHRDHAQSVCFASARLSDGSEPDWHALARPRQTLALYMGVARLEQVQSRLIAHGRAPSTPFVLVENGATPRQRVVGGTLAGLAATARRHALRAPALLIVGEVAALAARLAWFGTPPPEAGRQADADAA